MNLRQINKRLRELREEVRFRHFAFAEEYLVDLNATQAAIRVGYAVKGAGTEGTRLLQNPKVAEVVDLLRLKRSRRTGITADRVVQQIAKIAFADPSQVIRYDKDGNASIREIDDIQTPEAIKSIKVKEQFDRDGNRTGQVAEVVLSDPLRALELLGKHTAAFTENVNLTSGGKPLDTAPTTIINIAIGHRRRGQDIAAARDDLQE